MANKKRKSGKDTKSAVVVVYHSDSEIFVVPVKSEKKFLDEYFTEYTGRDVEDYDKLEVAPGAIGVIDTSITSYVEDDEEEGRRTPTRYA